MRYRPIFVAAVAFALASEAGAQEPPAAAKEPTAAAQQPAAADLGLTLVGTAADDSGGGLAIIRRADGATQFLELGHEIEGYTVARIEPSRVLLKSADAEIALQVPGANPGGPVATIRANFLSVLASVREPSWQEYQLGDRVFYLDSTGRPEASIRIPEELRGEEFAPTAPAMVRAP